MSASDKATMLGFWIFIGAVLGCGIIVAFTATYIWPWLEYLQRKTEWAIKQRESEWERTRDMTDDSHLRASEKPK